MNATVGEVAPLELSWKPHRRWPWGPALPGSFFHWCVSQAPYPDQTALSSTTQAVAVKPHIVPTPPETCFQPGYWPPLGRPQKNAAGLSRSSCGIEFHQSNASLCQKLCLSAIQDAPATSRMVVEPTSMTISRSSLFPPRTRKLLQARSFSSFACFAATST